MFKEEDIVEFNYPGDSGKIIMKVISIDSSSTFTGLMLETHGIAAKDAYYEIGETSNGWSRDSFKLHINIEELFIAALNQLESCLTQEI